jgi:hypothetical protein
MVVAGASLLVGVVVGCASPGPPRPPSLHIPAAVKDLSAERIGDQVVLRWTAPEKTTDKLPIKGTMTAVVCREVTPAIAGASGGPACVPIDRLTIPEGTGPAGTGQAGTGPAGATPAGQMEAVDHLPQPLTSDPVRLLTYRVVVSNVAGRFAPGSTPAFAAAGAAPQAVAGLRASTVKGGTVLEWQGSGSAGSGTDVVELTRFDKELAARNAAEKAAAKEAGSKEAAAKSAPAPPKTHFQVGPKKGSGGGEKEADPAEVHLRAGTSDSGGTVDHTAAMGETYTYAAQRVRTVTVAGHELKVRSAESSAVMIAVRDVFPPSVPSGLTAVQNLASENRAGSIDLSWEPSGEPDAETDLAGYVVYRRNVSASGAVEGAAVRLTATPVVETAFRDLTAVAGQRYSYTVTAVDASGNESKASAAAEETLRK